MAVRNFWIEADIGGRETMIFADCKRITDYLEQMQKVAESNPKKTGFTEGYLCALEHFKEFTQLIGCELVLCKDCEFGQKHIRDEWNVYQCKRMDYQYRFPSDFCSDGKKREKTE